MLDVNDVPDSNSNMLFKRQRCAKPPEESDAKNMLLLVQIRFTHCFQEQTCNTAMAPTIMLRLLFRWVLQK